MSRISCHVRKHTATTVHLRVHLSHHRSLVIASVNFYIPYHPIAATNYCNTKLLVVLLLLFVCANEIRSRLTQMMIWLSVFTNVVSIYYAGLKCYLLAASVVAVPQLPSKHDSIFGECQCHCSSFSYTCFALSINRPTCTTTTLMYHYLNNIRIPIICSSKPRAKQFTSLPWRYARTYLTKGALIITLLEIYCRVNNWDMVESW